MQLFVAIFLVSFAKAVPNNVQILGATSQTVILGGRLTLQCSGQGDPAPTLSWIFSSSTSDATTVGTGTTYTITNAQRTNGGTYVCRGTNSLGSTDSQGVTVDVQYTPIDARTDAQKSISAAVGSTISLVCAVDANPVASYEWYRSNQLVSNQREYTFALSSLALLGSYTCKATNSRGSVELRYTLSEGQPTPFIPLTSYSVLIGNDVLIPCTVSANSAATLIQWQFTSNSGSSTPISQSTTKYTLVGDSTTTSNLTINSAALTDAGTYRCSATNSVGTGSDSATLTITGNVPAVSVNQTSYSIFVGSSVTLNCFVSGNPAVSFVFWTVTRNGFTQNAQDSRYSNGDINNPSLTINNARQSDTGVFVCKAQNSAGTTDSSPISLTVSGTTPNVQIAQSSYSVNLGGAVELVCIVSADPPVSSITWARTINGVTSTLNIGSLACFTGGTVSNPSLTILNAQASDEGTYVCSAQSSAGTGQSGSTTLSIVGTSPNVTMAQSSYSVLTNGDVTLSCFVSANPSASISWTFTSNSGGVTAISASTSKYSLATSTTSSSLTVRSANSNDQGSYRCSATNSVGTGQATATLVVSGSLPSINLPSTYSVITGNDITMTCTVSANPAVNSVFWQFRAANGFSFTNITATFKYSISSLTGTSSLTVRSTTSSDNGQYRCQATNQVGTSQSTTVLTVSGSVPVVNIPQNSYSSVTGQDVQIPCSVSANPSATITWTFISTSQSQTSITTSTSKYTFNPSSTDGTLRIRSTSSSDTGTYRCQATNAVGTSSDSASLSVSGSPPSVNFGSSSYSVTTGQSIQLVCFVSASPTATDIAWTFQSNTGGGTTTITSSTSGYSLTTTTSYTQSTLTVLSAQSSNGGTYTCRATNLVGTRSASASLSVSGNIPTVTIPQNSYSVVTGQDVQIPCSVSASPSASISWIFISTSQSQITISSSTFKYTFNPTSTDGTLTVRSTTSSDTGTYHCQATNAIGTASDSASLSVSGSLPSVTITQTTYSVITGSNQQIPCFVSANPTASAIGWTFRSATSGTTVTITSSTSGYSIVTSSTSQSTLTVLAADNNDEGTYTCQATNQVGNGSDSAFLDVTSKPVVDISQNSYTAITGNNVVIPCTVSASPAATSISWRFTSSSGSEIQISSSSSKYSLSGTNNFPQLTILSVGPSDSGTYRCSATNLVGTSSDTASLTVTGSRPVVTIPSTNYNVVVGNSVTLPCTISASLSVTAVSWFFTSNSNNQIQITSSSIKYTVSRAGSEYNLTVSSAISSDAGVYECRATNAIDTSTDSTRLDVSGSIPVVTLPTTLYERTYGQNVTMQCSVTATPDITEVRWQRFVNGAYQDIFTQSSTKYYGSSITNFALTVTNLVFTDAGDYRCTATNQVGRGVSPNRATLSVLGGQPTPFIPLTSYSVLIGNDIQIPCTVSANPAATLIQWQFTSNSGSSTPISQSTTKYTLVGDSTSTSNLTINSAALTDAGTYRCSATNIVGTGSDSATLTITGIAPNVTIPDSDTSLSVQKRQNITIACEVTDALPKETSVLWEFRANQGDSGTLISVDGNPTKYQGGTVAVPSLTILSVAASDEGYYTCIASKVFGEGRSEQAFLEATGNAATVTVSPPSQSVLQKSTAIIQCFINNANPGVAEVLWEKISSGTSSSVIVTGRFNGSTPSLPDLIISDLQPSDAGTYYCSARNAIGTSRSSTGSNLIVTGAVPNNVQILGATSQTVNLGGSLTLQCSGQGNPAPTLSWIFSSSTSDATTVGTGTTYSITNAQRTNGGTYVCRGTNSLGSTDSQGVTVDVQYAPIDARTDAQKSLSAAVGSTVSLVCAVDANPVASYEWYRSNQLVSNQREYTFALSSLALLGSYTCKATNSRGSVELRYTLSEDTDSENAAIIATSVILPVIFFVLLVLALMIFLRRKRRNSSHDTTKQKYIPSVDKLVQESAKENRDILNVCHSKKDSVNDTIEDEEGYLKSFPVRKICNLPYTKSPTSLVPSKEEDENISNAYLFILE
eukprot:XP_019920311.1 PREDICTED: hemicentin-1 [Crassostrea gigas]